jgi:hypothetical protein
MTEERWLSAHRPDELLGWLIHGARFDLPMRKLRLFCRACCAGLLPRHPDRVYFHALQLMEHFADAVFDQAAYDRVIADLIGVQDDLDRIRAFAIALGDHYTSKNVAYEKLVAFTRHAAALRDATQLVKQSMLLREIFGNPFRPIAIDARWQSADVLDLANAIYQESAYERMPILADALMDAGGNEESLLFHCREPVLHVRGCWAIDVILGKA